MDKFNKTYKEIWFKLRPPHRKINLNRKCYNEWFILRKNDILNEMNTKVFPVPKKLLNELIELCYRNDWNYAYEFPFISIYNWMKESKNIEECFIDWKKMDDYRTYSLMFICLPYDLKTWKDELGRYFKEDALTSLFESFDNQNGASGTYSNGQIIIVNSDKIDSLKDCEEIIEHELIHMIEDINGSENTMTPSMKWILDSPNELKTYIVNLINSLFALYDHKQTMFTDEIDTEKSKREFLDDIFKSAEDIKIFEDFYNSYEKYINSRLMKNNLMFLWQLVQWKPDEFLDIKTKIYREFLE